MSTSTASEDRVALLPITPVLGNIPSLQRPDQGTPARTRSPETW